LLEASYVSQHLPSTLIFFVCGKEPDPLFVLQRLRPVRLLGNFVAGEGVTQKLSPQPRDIAGYQMVQKFSFEN
jgi:hypothetical protein